MTRLPAHASPGRVTAGEAASATRWAAHPSESDSQRKPQDPRGGTGTLHALEGT